MALINKIENTAAITFDGSTIPSNTVDTLLLLAPTITKTVDLLTASIGQTLTYTCVITNVGLTSITNLPFHDQIPEGATYVTDSFTVNGTPQTPSISANVLSYTIPSISALGVDTIQFKVTVVGGSL